MQKPKLLKMILDHDDLFSEHRKKTQILLKLLAKPSYSQKWKKLGEVDMKNKNRFCTAFWKIAHGKSEYRSS